MSKNPKITDEEIALIKSAQAGEITAFNRLYEKYKNFTTNLLYKFIKDYDESKEINNIVWLKVYNKLSKFKDYSSFGGWLRILTNRTAIDYLRTLDDSTYVSDSLAQFVPDIENEYDYGKSTVDSITYKQLVETFKQFPEDVRRVFELYYVDGLTVSEIHEVTKIPEGTIKSHLSRKRKLLKQKFNL